MQNSKILLHRNSLREEAAGEHSKTNPRSGRGREKSWRVTMACVDGWMSGKCPLDFENEVTPDSISPSLRPLRIAVCDLDFVIVLL